MKSALSAEARIAAASRSLARDEARLSAALRIALGAAPEGAAPRPPPIPDDWAPRLAAIARDAAGRPARRLGALVLMLAFGAAAAFLAAMVANAPEEAAAAADWRGLVPLGMAAAVPAGLLAAAIGIPISRRRAARRAREKARAARESLEGGGPGRFRRADLARSSFRLRLPSREGHPRWYHTGSDQ